MIEDIKKFFKPGPEFKISKSIEKFGKMLIIVFLIGGIQETIVLFTEFQQFIPDEVLPYVGLIVGLLEAIRNVLKNYKKGLQE